MVKTKTSAKLTAKKRADLKRTGVDESDFLRLEEDRNAKAADLLAADERETKRAKPGQGTQAAARRRREQRAKVRTAEQTYITLPDVSREVVSTDYDIYKHISTQLIFRRKSPEIGDPDPLTGKNLGETATVLSDEDKVALIAKKLKGSKWSAKTAESAATEILKVLNGDSITGVEHSDETVNHVVWKASFYTVKKKEDSWQGEKGKKTKLQKKFAIKGVGTGDTYAKEQHEAARGELRVFVQDGMKKLKGELVEGKQFEGAYVALYKKILIEVNPDDDEDPGRSAPAEEWLRSALPDSKAQA